MGFDRTHVLTFHIALPEEKYQKKDQVLGYYDRVLHQLQSLPSVISVACVTSLPSGWSWNWTEYTAEGRPPASAGEVPSTVSQIVTPDFLATLRVPLIKGRFISSVDGPNAPPVAVISESMARANWPDQDPIGKHLKLGNSKSSEPERRVVGVVGDIRTSAFDQRPNPITYVPFAQLPQSSSAIVVRTSTNPLSLAQGIIEQLRGIDSATPAYDVRTLQQVVSDNISGVESSARIMLIFGLIALALAAAGIFAVMAYSYRSALTKSVFAWRSRPPIRRSSLGYGIGHEDVSRRLDLWLWRITAADPRHFQRHVRRHSNRTAGLRLVDGAPRVRSSGGRLYSRALGHQGRSHARPALRLEFSSFVAGMTWKRCGEPLTMPLFEKARSLCEIFSYLTVWKQTSIMKFIPILQC